MGLLNLIHFVIIVGQNLISQDNVATQILIEKGSIMRYCM